MGQFILNGRNYSGLTYAHGVFIDADRILTNYNSSGGASIASYTATEDCFIAFYVFGKSSQTCRIYVDSVEILTIYFQGDGVQSPTLYLKKGQTLSFSSFDYWSFHYTVYGIQEGSPVTFLSEYASACYDTTEREVGCWVDGKPLYKRTWDFSASPIIIPYNDWADTGIPASVNIEKIISAESQYGSLANMGIEIATGAGGFVVGANKYDNTGNTRGLAYLTLLYTKTTDTAGSGKLTPTAMPTVHYDGNEKIIGTWFGETLYEKTIHIVEQSEQTNKNYTAEITSLNASHIKLKNAEVKLGSNGGNAWYTAPFWYDGSYNMCVAVSPNDMNIFSRGWQYTEAYVTLQYTKSS